MKIIRHLLIILLSCIILTACSTVSGLFDDKEDDEEVISDDVPARVLYQKANGEMASNRFADAIESYTLLESRYPFGTYAQQAQLELIYLYYRQSDTDSTIISAERFIKNNPQHPSIAYAYYMRALANFDKSKTLLNFVLPRNPSDKDPAPLLESFETFNSLIQMFPDTEYAEDAKQRMIYLRNELAEYELTVADFYMRRGAYLAAANRAQYVMERYQGAPAMPQAVYMLEMAYRQLEINDLAYDTRKIYAANYLNEDGGLLAPDYATEKISCARNAWQKVLEKVKLKTYYCD